VAGYSPESYLGRLARRMREGLAPMKPARRAAHTSAVLGFQREDGGFSGRRGSSDLYYTGFAVRALHALDRLPAELAAGVTDFVRSCEPASVVDALSLSGTLFLLDAPAPEHDRLLAGLELFRTTDGGYAKGTGRPGGDTYLTFLAALCYDLFGRRPPGAERLDEFLARRSAPDGGFNRTGAVDRSGTNPTAAGIALLLLGGASDAGRLEMAARFLVGSRHASGGWTAGARAPHPDLLSTYTALVSLSSLGALEAATASAARAFAEACERASGGFSALPGEADVDVEYTCYGLGVAALTGVPG